MADWHSVKLAGPLNVKLPLLRTAPTPVYDWWNVGGGGGGEDDVNVHEHVHEL